MLPVLLKFNGQPNVSPEGQIVYYFPELQVKATKSRSQRVPPYLEEILWRFSAASSGQIILNASLGVVYLVLLMILGGMLRDGTAAARLGGFVAFVQGIYGLMVTYGIGFLGIPSLRYFWIKWRNGKIVTHNRYRSERARLLANADSALQNKINYAQRFAREKIIGKDDSVYSTDQDLLEQEIDET